MWQKIINRKRKNQTEARGFTLIEMLVAVAVFVIVALVVTGALMIVIQAYRKAQSAKLVMDNLNYLMDQMTLDLREGTEYVGYNSIDSNGNNSPGEFDSIAFRARNGQIAHFSLADSTGSGGPYRVWTKRNCDSFEDDAACDQPYQMTDPLVNIIKPDTLPGLVFKIMPADPDDTSARHRKIIISLNGLAGTKEKTAYHLQTTVSQRNL